LWPAMFGSLGVWADPVDKVLTVEDGVVVRAGLWGPRLTPRLAVTLPVAILRSRHLDVSKWQDDELLARARELVAELEGRELVALAYQDVLATVDRALDVTALIGSLRGRYLPAAIRDVARLFGWTLLAGRPREVSALLSGVETKTIRVNRALEALAEEVRASPALASVFASEPAEGALFGALERAPEAQAFLESFRAMLDEFG